MANTFKTLTSQNIGVTPVEVGSYTPGTGAVATVIGLTVSNRLSTQVTVDIDFFDGGTTQTYILKGAPIPPGGALVPIGGDQKIVLENTDHIRVTSSDASSVDAIMSVLEIS